MIITIDGPIATGKSTIAKTLAHEIGYIFFDTGAMYRCITYAILKHKINPDDLNQLEAFLKDFSFDIKVHHGEKQYFVEGVDVSKEIRSEMITNSVSKISAIREVREKLVAIQRSWAMGVNAVFEGRDMGTVVFPHAEIKVFLTGRPEIRAKRRFDELRKKFPEETTSLTIEQALEDINRRDTYDSTREISPLKQAPDAFVVDTSDLTVDEIVYKILEYKDTIKTPFHPEN